MTWRGWLGFACAGCAGALAYRGDWLAAAGVTFCVLSPAAWRVRRQLLATRATMRVLAEMSEVAGSYARTPRLQSRYRV